MEVQFPKKKSLSERGSVGAASSKGFRVRQRNGVIKRGSLGMVARRERQQLEQEEEQDRELQIARQQIAAIVVTMQMSPEDSDLQEISCSALDEYAQRDEAHCRLIVEAGGLGAVARAMRDHLASSPIQEHGCAVLDALSFDEKNRHLSALLEAGVPELALAAMQAHRDNAAIAGEAVGVLRHLALASKQATSQIVSAGGIKSILDIVRQHPQEVDVQEPAIVVISSIANLSPEHLEKLLSLAALDSVVAAMNLHAQSATLQHMACAFLAMVAATGAARDKVGTEGLRVLLAALANHDSNVALLRDACTALHLLTHGHRAHAEFAVEHEAIELLQSAVAANPSDAKLRREAETVIDDLSTIRGDSSSGAMTNTNGGGQRVPIRFMFATGSDDEDDDDGDQRHELDLNELLMLMNGGMRMYGAEEDGEDGYGAAGMMMMHGPDSDEDDIEVYSSQEEEEDEEEGDEDGDDDAAVDQHFSRRRRIQPPRVLRHAPEHRAASGRRVRFLDIDDSDDDDDDQARFFMQRQPPLQQGRIRAHMEDSDDADDWNDDADRSSADDVTAEPAYAAVVLVGGTAFVAASAFFLYRWWRG